MYPVELLNDLCDYEPDLLLTAKEESLNDNIPHLK